MIGKLLKKAFFLTCIAIMIVPFTACHGAKSLPAFEVPETFDESKDVNITFWAKNDTNKTQVNIFNKAVEDFEALYPNIHVSVRFYTDYGSIYRDVITNIATQTAPNVCISYPDHIATYLTGVNIVAPLDALFDDPEYGLGGSKVKFDSVQKSEIIPEFLDECIVEGNYYAIPFMRSTEALYVNKTYVEKLGYELPEVVTWDFIWEVSEAAMAQDADGNYKVNGQKIMIPFIYKSTDNMMISMLKQLNSGYSKSDGTIEIFNDTTASILKEISKHSASGAFSTFKISSYPGNFFNIGQCIFAIDSTAGATWLGSDAPLSDVARDNFVDFETAVMPIPQYDTENLKMISQGPSICIFNKTDSNEVLASWLFAQFLLTNDTQIAYSETEGYVPVTSKAFQSPEYIDYLSKEGEDNLQYYPVKIQAAKLLLNNTKNTFVTPVFNGSASLRDAAGQLIEDVTLAVRRKKTVDDNYIALLYDNITSLYRLDQIKTGTGEDINQDLGKLPECSVALLISLGAVWVLIAVYVIFTSRKRK